MRFLVMIRGTDTGYSADVPDLPGCVAAGKTIKKVLKLMTRAIEMHLELMAEFGEKIPQPRTQMEFVIDEDAEEEFCTWVEAPAPEAVPS